LTLVKSVVKPAGSTNPAVPSSWTLSASPSAPKAGQSVTLSETPTAGVSGTWVASGWECSGAGLASQTGSVIVMNRAAEVTCTITNTLVDIMILKDVAIQVGADCAGGDEVWVDSLSMVVTGTKLCYRFRIINTGSAPLENVTLTDAMLGLNGITCGITTLGVNSATGCVQPHTASFTSGVVRTNTAVATGCATIGTKPCVKDDDTATYVASYQGFTPGFWKNHTAVNSNNAWRSVYIGKCIPPLVESTPGAGDYWNTPVTTIFPGTGSAVAFNGKSIVTIANYNGTGKPMTLLQALGLAGGAGDAGGNGILLRAATSSWLNACYNETDPTLQIGLTWPVSSANISATTVSALMTQTRAQRIALAGQYDLWNNTATHFIDWTK
jgi:Prealbumin-like fold domain